eukprot:15343879-Ditylum_brightwellii.AAC.1
MQQQHRNSRINHVLEIAVAPTEKEQTLGSQPSNKEELIIGIDANETDAEGTDLHSFLFENELVDAFCHLHLDATPPNTYQCSENCLDYIFITPALTPALKAVGFLPFNVPFLTDHGSLYANFDEDTLFWGNFINPLDQNQRKLVANNPTCWDKYVQILTDLFTDHKVCEKVAELKHQ